MECGHYGECSFELTGTDVVKSCVVVTFTASFVTTTMYSFNPNVVFLPEYAALGDSRNCQTSTFFVFSFSIPQNQYFICMYSCISTNCNLITDQVIYGNLQVIKVTLVILIIVSSLYL